MQLVGDGGGAAQIVDRACDWMICGHTQTLQLVTFLDKRFVTARAAQRATVCGMDESWRPLSLENEPQPRIRWARVHLTNFDRPTDAAKSMGIKPGTYRTYEHSKADGGRRPTLSEIQRIAKKYKVSWHWLASGEGSPHDVPEHPLIKRLTEKLNAIPPEKMDDVATAVEGVLEAFAKRA